MQRLAAETLQKLGRELQVRPTKPPRNAGETPPVQRIEEAVTEAHDPRRLTGNEAA